MPLAKRIAEVLWHEREVLMMHRDEGAQQVKGWVCDEAPFFALLGTREKGKGTTWHISHNPTGLSLGPPKVLSFDDAAVMVLALAGLPVDWSEADGPALVAAVYALEGPAWEEWRDIAAALGMSPVPVLEKS